MKSQTFFDLTEPFFMIILHTEKGQVSLFQNPVTVNRFVRDQHKQTYTSVHWVRSVGSQLTTSQIWCGSVENYEGIDRAWKEEQYSMCKSDKWKRENNGKTFKSSLLDCIKRVIGYVHRK